jgi:hypothetical protein
LPHSEERIPIVREEVAKRDAAALGARAGREVLAIDG